MIFFIFSRGSTKFLGDFVGNDKRFNVATTRAKYLAIIIGDERILNQVSDGSVNRIRVFGAAQCSKIRKKVQKIHKIMCNLMRQRLKSTFFEFFF